MRSSTYYAQKYLELKLETTKKLKYEIAFATHDPIIGPNAGSGEVGKKTLSWLHTFLLGDSCFCPYVLASLGTMKPFSHELTTG